MRIASACITRCSSVQTCQPHAPPALMPALMPPGGPWAAAQSRPSARSNASRASGACSAAAPAHDASAPTDCSAASPRGEGAPACASAATRLTFCQPGIPGSARVAQRVTKSLQHKDALARELRACKRAAANVGDGMQQLLQRGISAPALRLCEQHLHGRQRRPQVTAPAPGNAGNRIRGVPRCRHGRRSRVCPGALAAAPPGQQPREQTPGPGQRPYPRPCHHPICVLAAQRAGTQKLRCLRFCAGACAFATAIGSRCARSCLRICHLGLPAPAAAAHRRTEQRRQARACSARGPRQVRPMAVHVSIVTYLRKGACHDAEHARSVLTGYFQLLPARSDFHSACTHAARCTST